MDKNNEAKSQKYHYQHRKSSFDEYKTENRRVKNKYDVGKKKLTHIRDGPETEDKRQDEHDDKEELKQWAWDIFRILPRERSSGFESMQRVFRVCKVCLYLFLFLVVLLGTTCHKVSVLVMTSSVGVGQPHQNTTVSLLVIALCIPQALTFISTVLKTLFSSQQWPTFLEFLMLLMVEGVSCLAQCLLVIRILPQLDMMRGLFVMSSVCTIPALLKLFFGHPPEKETVLKEEKTEENKLQKRPLWFRCVWVLISLIAVLFQGSGAVLMSIGGFHQTNMTSLVNKGENNIIFGSNQSMATFPNIWELIVALLGATVLLWENFIDKDINVTYSGKQFTVIPSLKAKIRTRQIQQNASIFTSVWKIGIIISFPFIFLDNFSFAMYTRKSGRVLELQEALFYHLPAVTMILAAPVVIYFATLACKLRMQYIGFSLSLTMSTPLAALFIFFQCRYRFMPKLAYTWLCMEKDDFNVTFTWQTVCCILWWLSQLIITGYIWRPRQLRMEDGHQLFVHLSYDAVLLEQWLMLNRRRRDGELPRLVVAEETTEEGSGSVSCSSSSTRIVPKIYACATMWHETRNEMTQLLKSVFRMDSDCCARKLAVQTFGIYDPDMYEFETHILFDDSMEQNDKEEFVPNDFVKMFLNVVNEAASAVHHEPIDLGYPERTPTPYGGRLTWRLPGDSILVVHLKDKNKIRHKKRWSQSMYMYYLLGYKGTAKDWETELSVPQVDKDKKRHYIPNIFTLGDLFESLPPRIAKEAENTFILALDGDVDFKPDAVRLLVDIMRKNKKVGAACGRIHPIGSGPMVWFQEFEYAIGHWLQKAAEHVFGCVLCSPGCFSLFRGSALMDDNVMRTYLSLSEQPRHFVQFDQGEDRWLCTLLLQQGYRIEYCAASDALTFAPETFNEFYNQRRRWGPSTMANILDLLSNYESTVNINDNISTLYILYQFVLFSSALIGPSTILMMLASSYTSILGTSLIDSYILAFGPAAFYLLICFKTTTKTQLNVAAFMTSVYAIIMLSVIVATMIQISMSANISDASVVFLLGMLAFYVLAALFHPLEFSSVVYGILYFLAIPSSFVLLMIYSFCNIHVVSWGTREVAKKKSKEEIEKEKKVAEEKKAASKSGILSMLGLGNLIHDIKKWVKDMRGQSNKENKETNELLKEVIKLKKIRKGLDNTKSKQTKNDVKSSSSDEGLNEETIREKYKKKRDEQTNPAWIEDESVGCGDIKYLSKKETSFWLQMIKLHLQPLSSDEQKQKAIKQGLLELRDSIVFAWTMINVLWAVLILQMQLFQDDLAEDFSIPLPRIDNPQYCEFQGPGFESRWRCMFFTLVVFFQPIGLAFLFVFGVVLSLQMIAMFIHRWETFLQIMSITEIPVPWEKKLDPKSNVQAAISFTSQLQKVQYVPEVDYIYSSDESMEKKQEGTHSALEDKHKKRHYKKNERRHHGYRHRDRYRNKKSLVENFNRRYSLLGKERDAGRRYESHEVNMYPERRYEGYREARHQYRRREREYIY